VTGVLGSDSDRGKVFLWVLKPFDTVALCAILETPGRETDHSAPSSAD
jgi:hypothetical protein